MRQIFYETSIIEIFPNSEGLYRNIDLYEYIAFKLSSDAPILYKSSMV